MAKKKYENEEAIKVLRKGFNDNIELDLPGDIKFELEENSTKCRIKMNLKKIQDKKSGEKNMQKDSNAFEAWAVAMHIALEEPGIIILDSDGEIDNIPYEGNGHWGRFLYRALRFSEQYGQWFKLSERIEVLVKNFKEYLDNNCFINNVPDGEAGIKEDQGLENKMESELANSKELKNKIGCANIYRQLPVGLFKLEEDNKSKKPKDRCKRNKLIFTGGKSAIDMWSWNEGEFKVIELKADNRMIGIITEIFFYSNYMYDFLVRGWDSVRLNEPSDFRGYSNIMEHKKEFKKVCGIMLADKFHPIIENDEVLKVLNDIRDGVNIKYAKLGYNYEVKINDVE